MHIALTELGLAQRSRRGRSREPSQGSCLIVGILALFSVFWVVGCGGSSSAGSSLDCAYLASDNCWKTTAALAPSCLPPSSEVGTLSADGKTCTYASGTVVTFASPIVLPMPSNATPSWNFTVKTATGDTCLAYQDNSNGGITLTVQGQTVKESVVGTVGLALSCPDGTRYSNSNALSLFSCPDGGLTGLPGSASSSSDTSVSLSLLATTSDPSSFGTPVFNCQKGS